MQYSPTTQALDTAITRYFFLVLAGWLVTVTMPVFAFICAVFPTKTGVFEQSACKYQVKQLL
jgi:hypothetical protein